MGAPDIDDLATQVAILNVKAEMTARQISRLITVVYGVNGILAAAVGLLLQKVGQL